jgi:ParB/RepB/Spo0J family partition protein
MCPNFFYEIRKVPIDKIRIGKFRIRANVDEEHIKVITNDLDKVKVQIDPIELWSNSDELHLMDGEHRILSQTKRGEHEIISKVWSNMTEEEAYFFVLRKNTMHKQTAPMEEGKLILQLIENYHYTQKQVAEELSRNESWVSSRLLLVLSCSDSIKKDVENGKLSFSKAQIISKLPQKKQRAFADKIIKNKWSLEQVKDQYELIINPSLKDEKKETKKDTEEEPSNIEAVSEVSEEPKKERYEIRKRTQEMLEVVNNLSNGEVCNIKIINLDKRKFFCVTHNSLFCAIITQFLKNLDIKDFNKIPLTEEEKVIDKMAEMYMNNATAIETKVETKEEPIISNEEIKIDSINKSEPQVEKSITAFIESETVEKEPSDDIELKVSSDNVELVEEDIVKADIENSSTEAAVEESPKITDIERISSISETIFNHGESISKVLKEEETVDIVIKIPKSLFLQFQDFCNKVSIDVNTQFINLINYILKKK